MKQLGDLLLRSVGFGRNKPKTPIGRSLRRSNQLLTVLVLVWFGLHLFPQILFAHHVTAQGVTVYAREPLPEETAQRIAQAVTLVAKSELAIAGRRERIFICNQPWLFGFLAPTSFRAFAFSMPMTDNIFVADADIARDLSRSRSAMHNTRSFSAVMAHEITHGLIHHRLGFVRSLLLPGWIAEGYCDYVAQESSFPEAEGAQLLASGREESSSSFHYFLFRKIVTHLIDGEGLSFDQLVARRRQFQSAKAETISVLSRAL